jgi:gas vesicle protein
MALPLKKFRKKLADSIYPSRSPAKAAFASAFFAGIASAATALFLTPRTGKQNQDLVKAKLQNYADDARKMEHQADEKFQSVKEDFQSKVNDIRSGVSSQTRTTVNNIKSKLNEVKDQVADRFEMAAERLKAQELDLEESQTAKPARKRK